MKDYVKDECVIMSLCYFFEVVLTALFSLPLCIRDTIEWYLIWKYVKAWVASENIQFFYR